MSVELIRLFVVLLATAAGHALGKGGSVSSPGSGGGAVVGALLGACVGYVAGGVLGRLLHRVMGTVEHRVEAVPAASLLAACIGAVACGVFTALLAVPAGLIAASHLAKSAHQAAEWMWGGVALLVWLGVAEGWRLGRRKSVELLGLAGLRVDPNSVLGASGENPISVSADVAGLAAQLSGPIASALATALGSRDGRLIPLDDTVRPGDGALVDTSAVIDGRLLVLAQAGFLPRPLLVARCVLDEIQGIADTADPGRRRRGRRGLEMLATLRREPGCELRVLEDEVPEHGEVDAKLVALARRLGVGLVTVDAPLQGNAELQGVRCFNLARLADGLRPTHVPGDVLPLALAREGREAGQAVGFLEDGTMVVVAEAAGRVGQEVNVRVSSGVQTSMGRMLFATVSDDEEPAPIAS